jgi:ribosome-binding factor A
MVDVARSRKLAVRIREVVASTLELQVKDPRLGMVTITDAKLTPDLREATLYYTVYGDQEAQQATAMALESAKGVLRTQVGRQTGVRYTPSLAFVADVVPQTTGRLEELIEQARRADARVHEIAERATPAGEADPYRAPRAVSDDDADSAAEDAADDVDDDEGAAPAEQA